MPKAKPVLPTPLPDLPRYLTIEQTADRLGFSTQTVRLFITEGRLSAIDISASPDGRCSFYRIPADARVTPKTVLSRF